jgi:hypothetical protein
MANDIWNGIEVFVAYISDPGALRAMHGISEKLDSWLGLIGADKLSQVLKEGLPGIFEGDPELVRRAQNIFEAIDSVASQMEQEAALGEAARLLGDIFEGSKELQKEVNHELWKSFQVGMARDFREGNISFWSGEGTIEKLLRKEYESVETEIFDRYRAKLGHSKSRLSGRSSPASLDAPTVARDIENGTDLSVGKVGNPALVQVDSRVALDILAWDEMQAKAREIDASELSPKWKKDPQRSILWLLQNGVQEQLFIYLYHHLDILDAELRGTFISILESDDLGRVPLVWKTAMMRALSRPSE